MNEVVRSGATVIRSAGTWTPSIHRLLRHLRAQGLDWVPEPLGMAPEDKEVIQFIEGIVPTYPMPEWIWQESLLIDAARKLRALHDATIGYVDEDAIWRLDAHDPIEVICHNDFAPYNMVFDSGTCVGVIDFDMASPGPRLWDLAYLAYRIVPLTSPSNPDGLRNTDANCIHRLDLLIAAYGKPFELAALAEMTITRLHDLARFSDTMAVQLDRPELLDHAQLYRADADWLRQIATNFPTQ